MEGASITVLTTLAHSRVPVGQDTFLHLISLIVMVRFSLIFYSATILDTTRI